MKLPAITAVLCVVLGACATRPAAQSPAASEPVRLGVQEIDRAICSFVPVANEDGSAVLALPLKASAEAHRRQAIQEAISHHRPLDITDGERVVVRARIVGQTLPGLRVYGLALRFDSAEEAEVASTTIMGDPWELVEERLSDERFAPLVLPASGGSSSGPVGALLPSSGVPRRSTWSYGGGLPSPIWVVGPAAFTSSTP